MSKKEKKELTYFQKKLQTRIHILLKHKDTKEYPKELIKYQLESTIFIAPFLADIANDLDARLRKVEQKLAE